MNAPTPLSDAGLDEQASLWAARLEGDGLTAADRQRLEAWLAVSPGHRARLSAYCQLSVNLQAQLAALAAAGALERAFTGEAEAGRPVRHRPRRRPALAWSGAALAAAAAVALGFLLAWYGPSGRTERLDTAAGQRRSFTLADGTRVELNAHSQLVVELRRRERHVRLAGGEAFFAVARDRARPFVVDTPGGSVRVTGTVFDVRTEGAAELEVTVVEGAVQVRPTAMGGGRPDAVVSLVAADQLSAGTEGVGVRALSPGDLEDALAWRQGQIVFNGVSLGTALARFARYHARSIAVTPEAAKLTLAGRFSLDDLDGFLTELAQALPVQVRPGPAGALEVSLRPPPG
jgi:transmembrane sensor